MCQELRLVLGTRRSRRQCCCLFSSSAQGGSPSVPSQGLHGPVDQRTLRDRTGKESFGHVLHRRMQVSRDPKGAGESGVRMEKRKTIQADGMAISRQWHRQAEPKQNPVIYRIAARICRNCWKRGARRRKSSWNFLQVPLSLWLRTNLCCEIPQGQRTTGKGRKAPGMLPDEQCSELTQGHGSRTFPTIQNAETSLNGWKTQWSFSKGPALEVCLIRPKGKAISRSVCTQSLQLCPTLCSPMDCSPSGSSVHGILQARILEWVAMASSRGSFWPRNLAGRLLYH